MVINQENILSFMKDAEYIFRNGNIEDLKQSYLSKISNDGWDSFYEESKKALQKASEPPKKKIYRDLTKMLQECYFVGSLKYGNNFIM